MDQASGRLDFQFSGRDSASLRYSHYRVEDHQPFGTSAMGETLLPGFGRVVTTRADNLALSYSRTFGRGVLHEFQLGWFRARGGQLSPNAGNEFARTAGLQGVTGDPRDSGFPQVSFGGQFGAFGDPTTFVTRDDRSVELYDKNAGSTPIVLRCPHLLRSARRDGTA